MVIGSNNVPNRLWQSLSYFFFLKYFALYRVRSKNYEVQLNCVGVEVGVGGGGGER